MKFITFCIRTAFEQQRLSDSARKACNFWNYFLAPSLTTMIDIFVVENDQCWAITHFPTINGNQTIVGKVELSKNSVIFFDNVQLASLIIHEIAHVLGFGFKWGNMIDTNSNQFCPSYFNQIPGLNQMYIESDGEPHTKYLHWSETKHGNEIMTGGKNLEGEVLNPTTLKVMSLFNNTVKHEIDKEIEISEIINSIPAFPLSDNLKGSIRQMSKSLISTDKIWHKRNFDFSEKK